MKPRPRKSSQAQRDLTALLRFFEKVDPFAGVRFLDAFDRTLDMIGDFPDLGSVWEFQQRRLRKIRYWAVRGFENTLVVYQNTATGPLVLRVVDARQNLDEIL